MRRTGFTTVAAALVVLASASALAVLAAPAADKLNGPLPAFPAFTSTNYAGYVDIPNGSRRSYYWFLESESNPTTDPLILWLNGGPGCSSLLGLFTEIGPYLLKNGGVWTRNDFAWNKQANVLFVESPCGVGFSIDGTPATTWNDSETSALNYAFLSTWLSTKFPEYKGRPFYIAGESYAGHYIPQLAKRIVDGSDADLKSMFKGFMAGNPCTGAADGSNLDWCFVDDDPTLTEFRKSHGLQSYDSRIPWAPGNRDEYDPYNFLVRTCGDNLDGLQATWRGADAETANVAGEASKVVDTLHGGGGAYGPCSEQHLREWLRRDDVIAAIHAVAPPAPGWAACANIKYPIWNTTEGVLPTYRYLMDNTTLKMMIYSGTADTVVNFIQTQKVLNSLNRPVVQNFTAWFYQDLFNYTWKQLGGYYNVWDRISWAGVRGAGHMVPSYVPAPAYQLLQSFIQTGLPGLAPSNQSNSAWKPIQPPPTPPPSPTPTGDAPPAPAGSGSSSGREVGLVLAGVVGGAVVSLVVVGAIFALRGRRRVSDNAAQDAIMMN